MRGLDPRIHLLREKVLTKIDGLPGSSPAMTDLNLVRMGLDPRIHLLAKSFDRFALPDRRGFAPAVDLSRRER
jgi:hypothetical protein